jgi:hypothetical protein
MPTINVPKRIQMIANRAIEYNMSLPISKRAAYKEDNNKKVPGTGMRTAKRLASGAVDLEQLRLMDAWFARHGESEQEATARQDQTSKAAIAWALWGGSPAQRWVKQAIKQLEKNSE